MNTNGSDVLVFESGLRGNFYPLTYTRLAADLFFGTRTLLEGIGQKLSRRITDVYVPKYLEAFAKEVHPSVSVNKSKSKSSIIFNSLVSQKNEFWDFALNALNEIDETVYRDSLGNLVFGKIEVLDPLLLDKGMKNHSKIKIKELPTEIGNIALIKYPWELVNDNPEKITSDFLQNSSILPKSNDIEIRGSKISIVESAEIERFVTLDSRKGPIIIEEDVEIQSFSHLSGPCFIGRGTKVKSAKIREGTSIAHDCKVAGEIESSIVSERTNKSHEGYLGHSIVGSWVNLGALTTNSNMKNTYGKINVKMGRKLVSTGQIKVGAILGDMSKTAIGTLLTTGRKVGVGSHVFGTILEDVPSFTMYGKSLGARSAEDTCIECTCNPEENDGKEGSFNV